MALSRLTQVYLALLIIALPGCAASELFTSTKFRMWFSNWGQSHNSDILTNPAKCQYFAHEYWHPQRNDTFPWKCSRLLDCYLNNTAPSSMQMLATSMVVLGLTPTMLSQLGPNIAESAMISSQNLGLAVLLSFGSPALPVPRILTYDDPFDTLKTDGKCWDNRSTILNSLPFLRMRKYRRAIQILEYLAMLGVILNTVLTSLDLGVRSVSTFICTSWYLPLSWVLLAGGVHILGAFSFWLRLKLANRRAGEGPNFGGITAMRDRSDELVVLQPPAPDFWALFVWAIAGMASVAHLTYGTLVFSSLMFLTVIDAMPIIARYALSSVVSRLISYYELTLISERYRVSHETPMSMDK